MKDKVNHPDHYNKKSIECIHIIETMVEGLNGVEAVCIGNAVKYLYRWKDKGGKEDLRKAIWYIQRLLNDEGEDESPDIPPPFIPLSPQPISPIPYAPPAIWEPNSFRITCEDGEPSIYPKWVTDSNELPEVSSKFRGGIN